MVKRDGGHFWARLTASAAPGKDDQPTIRIVLSDISAQKQAEAEKEKLATQNRRLQKAESLGCMAGAIAHHCNNQLQTVMLSLELAILSQPKGSESAAALARGRQTTREAAEMGTLLLTYIGQEQVKNEPLDLSVRRFSPGSAPTAGCHAGTPDFGDRPAFRRSGHQSQREPASTGSHQPAHQRL